MRAEGARKFLAYFGGILIFLPLDIEYLRGGGGVSRKWIEWRGMSQVFHRMDPLCSKASPSGSRRANMVHSRCGIHEQDSEVRQHRERILLKSTQKKPKLWKFLTSCIFATTRWILDLSSSNEAQGCVRYE